MRLEYYKLYKVKTNPFIINSFLFTFLFFDRPRHFLNYFIYCLVLFGFVWFCLVLFGFVWFCLVLFGFVWFCLVLFGFVWFCLVLFGFVWFCLVLFGFSLLKF